MTTTVVRTTRTYTANEWATIVAALYSRRDEHGLIPNPHWAVLARNGIVLDILTTTPGDHHRPLSPTAVTTPINTAAVAARGAHNPATVTIVLDRTGAHTAAFLRRFQAPPSRCW